MHVCIHTHNTHTICKSGQIHLLVRLHLASNYPEGISGGVVIDLDSAEGLGSCPRWQPLLIAIVIDHHSGPSLANTRLTGIETKTQNELKTHWKNFFFFNILGCSWYIS